MKKGLKRLVATLCIGVMVMNAGVVTSNAKVDYEKYFDRIGTKVTLFKGDRTVTAAQSLCVGKPQKKDIPFVSGATSNWCSRFAALCVGNAHLMYGEITEADGTKRRIADSCTLMRNEIKYGVVGVYHEGSKGYMPQKGDLVFYNKDGNPADVEHVGIVVDAGGNAYDYWIETIEGNNEVDGVRTVERVDKYNINYNGISSFATIYDKNNSNDYVQELIGDANGDGKVDQNDATKLLKICMNYQLLPSNEKACDWIARCDVTGNGVADQLDATGLLRGLLYKDVH